MLGLKWSDIDLERGDLRVQRQIGRIDGKIMEMPLKTKNAYRTLPLSADAIDVLMQQRRKTGNSEWVFPSPSGGPMSPDSVLHMLQRVLKRAGLPRIRFHDLRHTFATMPCKTAWTSRPSAVCWVTTRRALRWTPTPTLPPTPNSKPPRPWAISYPVRYRPFRYPLPLGSAFGSEKSNTIKTELMKSKSPRNQTISRTFGTP